MNRLQASFKRPLTGRHVLLALLAFFGVVFAANGAFVYLALGSWSGVADDNAYGRGLHYQAQLDAAKAQAARGWTLDLARQTLDDGRIRLDVLLRGPDGAPLDGLTIHGQLRRPAAAALDQAVALVPQGLGHYVADLNIPAAGQWDLWLETGGHDGVPHRHRERLWVAP